MSFDAITRSFDVVIVGGGPAGATAGALLAQAGHSVGLCEQGRFPRFHVGESLVPAVNLILERLGLGPQMERSRFPRKHAVQFLSPRGKGRPFYFSEVSDPRMHRTWQVLRSDFDRMMLENAVCKGVCAFTQTRAVDVLTDGGIDGHNGTVRGVTVRGPDGSERVLEARVVVDASGSDGLLARRFGHRHLVPGLQNTSVYAHYRDVILDEGIDAGSTLIFRIDTRCWIWLIPLPDAVSIGLVAPADRISDFGSDPESILQAAIDACPLLGARLERAERVSPVRAVRDFSYRAARDGGPGWLLIGDALGFIDPMYSTGLFLSMYSAELAAEAIGRQLHGSGRPDLAGFSRDYQSAFDKFLVLVRAYYREDFGFGEFAKDPIRRQGLVDLLTGNVATAEAGEVSRALEQLCGDNAPDDVPSVS